MFQSANETILRCECMNWSSARRNNNENDQHRMRAASKELPSRIISSVPGLENFSSKPNKLRLMPKSLHLDGSLRTYLVLSVGQGRLYLSVMCVSLAK
uniref:Uncharacterized protein n=1 Tax=Trichobilharzia regenti TaxID=157069 RepID=A0AA85KEJ5_TRIRE|nr:unnamed protein product [Trichobilharzia regenti]